MKWTVTMERDNFREVVAIINTSPDTVALLSNLLERAGFVVVSTFTHSLRDGHVTSWHASEFGGFYRSKREEKRGQAKSRFAALIPHPQALECCFQRSCSAKKFGGEWHGQTWFARAEPGVTGKLRCACPYHPADNLIKNRH